MSFLSKRTPTIANLVSIHHNLTIDCENQTCFIQLLNYSANYSSQEDQKRIDVRLRKIIDDDIKRNYVMSICIQLSNIAYHCMCVNYQSNRYHF